MAGIKTKTIKVTYDEWYAELVRTGVLDADKPDPNYLTAKEITEKYGICLARTRGLLAKAKALGLLDVRPREITTISGVRRKIVAYRIRSK